MFHGVNAITQESASFPNELAGLGKPYVSNAAEAHSPLAALEAKSMDPLLGPTWSHSKAKPVTVGVHSRLGKLRNFCSRQFVDGSHRFLSPFLSTFQR
jgi:hypothetical protein